MAGLKELTRDNLPGLFGVLRSVKHRVTVEWRTLKYLKARDLARLVRPRRDLWRTQLPVQSARRLRVPYSMTDALREITTADGGHARYLSPERWACSPLAEHQAKFPPDAGIKLVRAVGDVGTGEYLSGDGHSHVQRQVLHGHGHLMLVANVLHLEGLGPRLYDVVEVEFSDGVHVGYVSQHVAGRTPNQLEWQQGMERLRSLQSRDLLTVVAPGGLSHEDFREPDCSGNAWVTAAGDFQYVDFQNFVLGAYSQYLEGIVMAAAERSHFGDRSVLRGGRYLYQSVPGVDRSAKRDIAPRVEVLRGLFRETQTELSGRTVLDIGCNIGMMLGSYLKEGAAWCHGWDKPEIVPHTAKVLLATGCTRFSLTGGMLAQDRNLVADLPEWLRDGRKVVVSYLAVHGHIGWLDGLQALPWDLMIYESHEGEDEAMAHRFIATLGERIPCKVMAMTTYRDGDSDPRVLALIQRLDQRER